MKSIFNLAVLIAATLSLAACGSSTIYPSESVYTRHEVRGVSNVQRCRVIDVRHVAIGATGNEQGRYDRPTPQFEETAGAIGGAIIGGMIARQIGSGAGQDFATAIGTSIGSGAGQQLGARLAQRRQQGEGIEYSILNAQGREQIVVQNLNPTDRILRIGETCRLAIGGSGVRILPAEHIAGTVARPAQTTFY